MPDAEPRGTSRKPDPHAPYGASIVAVLLNVQHKCNSSRVSK